MDFFSRLPDDLIRVIKEFVPKKTLVFTNKENYNLYHHLLKKSIKNYENYIRDTIRRDNEYVFDKIVRENYMNWKEIKRYAYKNMVFYNYCYFVINYCIENESENCRNILSNFLAEQGLCKNLHKKNVVKYIKWRN